MSKYQQDLKFIHFWKCLISDEELQAWLDKMSLYNRRCWLILLDEKLRRVENEIAIV